MNRLVLVCALASLALAGARGEDVAAGAVAAGNWATAPSKEGKKEADKKPKPKPTKKPRKPAPRSGNP